MQFSRIEAVIFDMDGTLVDSEPLSWKAIERALSARALSGETWTPEFFHGLTWHAISEHLNDALSESHAPIMAGELQDTFHQLHLQTPPQLIPGALEAISESQQLLPTAICTSSQRQSLEALLHRLKLLKLLPGSVCAEDCTRSKPDPQGYRLAAERLEVSPGRCLVFEDSLAGVQAAKAAGMNVVAITGAKGAGSPAAKVAHGAISDYTELPADFFRQWGQ